MPTFRARTRTTRARRTAKPSTRLGDVARLAGVSTATVSRAINETGAVSDVTRRRVLRAVQKLHYHPNAHARSLALGRSNQIGLLVSDIANPFFPELVKAIEREAMQRGFEVILAETDYDHERLGKSVGRFLEREVAGVIIMASEVDLSLVAGLARRRVPLVFLDLEVTGQGTSTVSVDYARGIDEAVHHLAELGHRELAYVGGPPTLSSAAKRLQAFQAAVARYIGPRARPRVYDGDFRLESGLRAGDEILASKPRPTAVLAANDIMALGVVKACRAQGLSIPRDLSVVGFDDIAFASLADPPLSTVCLPRDALAREATAALLRSLDGDSEDVAPEMVPTYFVARGSTGPAPQ
jgi:DNA-binding LacI/PurR family transcriptional regulator